MTLYKTRTGWSTDGGGSDLTTLRSVYFVGTTNLNRTFTDVVVGDIYVINATWSYRPGDNLGGTGWEKVFTECVGDYPAACRYWIVRATDTTMTFTFSNQYSIMFNFLHCES